MGHHKTTTGRATRALLGACTAALLLFAFSTPLALADPPSHARKATLDVTGLNKACGTAVDSKGDLYASSAGTDEIKVYAPADHATPIAQIANSNEPCGLAVDTKGNLYVSEQGTGNVVMYEPDAYPLTGSPSYDPAVTIDASGKAKGIAVDPVNNRLYVAEGDHVAVYKSDGTFEINVGSGNLTDASGASAYTYTNTGANNNRTYLAVADAASDEVKVFSGEAPTTLKLRRTISGVDQDAKPSTPNQSFGFGTAGAYLGADPGNEITATRKCTQVAGQACTAGHFFLYDDEHGVIDEFDASGEFVDQLTNASLADAEPTQVAVDRSGGAGDGTIYVSSGASTGAKLVAFGPLSAPARTPLPALSRALGGTRAVATDFVGNVYVATPTEIHVYSPTGSKITSFEDAVNGGAQDLAVDSKGNVYVVDGVSSLPELAVTYYHPSTYPPSATTTYTRQADVIPSEAIPSGQGVVGVAVNPTNDHVFAVGTTNATFPQAIVELGPASEGSPLLDECGSGLVSGARLDIDVYGATGEVYVTTASKHQWVLKCGAEKEVIREFRGGGCPNGEVGPSPRIAVDQSNGHVLEFSILQTGEKAREYDAAGACVAEYGSFSATSGSAYRVAVDNSCALHDPPLSEQTAPTCAATFPANGTAYVAYDSPNNVEQPYDVSAFGPLDYPKPIEEGEAPVAATGEADEFGPDSATLHGEVEPRGTELEECRFEYLTEAEYDTNGETFAGAEEAPCAESPEEIGEGGLPVAVQTGIEGLEQDTPYRFRLVATNAFGTSEGDAEAFVLEPPAIEARDAQPVGFDEATLRAEIDPSGLATTYRFEYGTEEGVYPQSTAEKTIPAGEGFVAVKAPIAGLAEGGTYHFRAIAENAVGPVQGEDRAFTTLERAPPQECPNAEYRTGLSTYLPDCRAYELVTPAETRGLAPNAQTSNSGQPYANSYFVAPRGEGAGERVNYQIGALPGFNGTGHGDGFQAQRGPGEHPEGGWGTELYGFSFAQNGGGIPGSHGVSPDQRYWLWDVLGIETPSGEEFPVGNYLRLPAGEANPDCSPPKGDPALEFELVGCAGLEAGEEGPDPKAEGRQVSAGGTHLIFTSKVQLEAAAAPSGTEAIYDREAGSSAAEVISVKPDGTAFESGEGAKYIAATEDGSAVVFSVGGALYLHRGGATTQVADAPSTFDGISEDGTRVFFMDATFGIPPAPPPPSGLFACDTQAGACAGLEKTQEPTEIAANAIFVNVSADGSSAFFTSKDALGEAGEENANGEEAQAGQRNLYAWNGVETDFIAILAQSDFEGFKGEGSKETQETLAQWTRAIPGQLESAVEGVGRASSPTRSTPDGEVLVFQSHAQLTSYDNEGHGEIYRYGPGAQLDCVSCNPANSPANADALLQTFQPEGRTNLDTLVPNLTDDGQRVFFNSVDPLLPEDANSVTDVYEWKAQGTEGPGGDSCKRPGGCLALISSGQGEKPSHLYGMSADGHDVFFVAQDKLVGQDVAGSPSLYDARVGGGIPDPPTLEECQGDACQGGGSLPPALPAPATTGPGVGNQTPSRACPKGKRRAKGRCLAKHPRKRHKKHAKHKNRANHNRGANR